MELLVRALILAFGIYMISQGVLGLQDGGQALMLTIANHLYKMRPGRYVYGPDNELFAGHVPLTECEERAYRLAEQGRGVGGFNYYPNAGKCEVFGNRGMRTGQIRYERNTAGANPHAYSNSYLYLQDNFMNELKAFEQY